MKSYAMSHNTGRPLPCRVLPTVSPQSRLSLDCPAWGPGPGLPLPVDHHSGMRLSPSQWAKEAAGPGPRSRANAQERLCSLWEGHYLEGLQSPSAGRSPSNKGTKQQLFLDSCQTLLQPLGWGVPRESVQGCNERQQPCAQLCRQLALSSAGGGVSPRR
jgi:hypothetical protein